MLEDIVLGMTYIHHMGITHRDLKPLNILYTVQPEFCLKICDFGISKEIATECMKSHSVVGTTGYKAPEVCNASKYGRKCDVWSFGVLASQILGDKDNIPDINFSENNKRYQRALNAEDFKVCLTSRKYARNVFLAKDVPELFSTVSWKPEDRPEFWEVMGPLLKWKAHKGLSCNRNPFTG
jgi:serine/threonine protein kinase